METGVPKGKIEITDAAAEGVRPHANAAQEKEARAYIASQWTLMWWRFRRHKLALFSAVVLLFIYLLVMPFAEFFAPFPPDQTSTQLIYAPPQTLILFDESGFNPHVFGYKSEIDPVALRRTF